jgi:hypothetical protein
MKPSNVAGFFYLILFFVSLWIFGVSFAAFKIHKDFGEVIPMVLTAVLSIYCGWRFFENMRAEKKLPGHANPPPPPISQTAYLGNRKLHEVIIPDNAARFMRELEALTNPKYLTFEEIKGLLDLIKHASEVFGTVDKAYDWLAANNFHFDGKPPIEFLKQKDGIKFIDDRLTGLEHGDNA